MLLSLILYKNGPIPVYYNQLNLTAVKLSFFSHFWVFFGVMIRDFLLYKKPVKFNLFQSQICRIFLHTKEDPKICLGFRPPIPDSLHQPNDTS